MGELMGLDFCFQFQILEKHACYPEKTPKMYTVYKGFLSISHGPAMLSGVKACFEILGISSKS